MTQEPTAIVIGADFGEIAATDYLEFGLIHNFWRVGYLRPRNHHKKYKNLYFTVAPKHPDTGWPVVRLPKRITIERVIQDKGTISVQNMVNLPVVTN